MSLQEKRKVAYIITVVLVFLGYCIYLVTRFRAGSLDVRADFRFWGTVVLVLIPVQIVLNIVLTIIFEIVHTVITGEKADDMTDEREKLMELKGIRISYTVAGLGFLIAMITVVMGLPPFIMFNIVFFAFNAGEVAGTVGQLIMNRVGV